MYKSHISEYDEAYNDLQQVDSFDTNLILLKHKLDPIDANLNSQKRKLHDGRIGIFGFSILAIFRSVFRFLYQKTSVLVTIATSAVSVLFQSRVSVFGKNKIGFLDLLFDVVWCFQKYAP